MLLSDDSKGTLASILPTLGVLAFAVLRIFPAVQQSYHSLTQMRFTRPILDKIHADMTGRGDLADIPLATAAPDVEPLTLTRALTLHDLHFGYPAAGRAALSGLTLTVPARATVGIVGGTGAGKTTAVDLILGLLQPESGWIEVDGLELGPGTFRHGSAR